MSLISVEQFVTNYNGKSVDFDHVYNAQCVDLFNFYQRDVIGGEWIGTPRTNGARDLYEVDSPVRAKYYKKLPADVKLQAGDVLVWGEPYGRSVENGVTTYYGHVAVYVGGGRVIQQNSRISFRTTVDGFSTKGLLGVLRPLRFIGENSPQDVPTTQNNQNKHSIKKGDTFWGLEESNGWMHGTLQQLNPGIDPRKLQIGSEINIPGQPTTQQPAAEEYYTVRQGDTFWALEDARQLQHGTLQQLNPGVDPRSLQIGQRIRIK